MYAAVFARTYPVTGAGAVLAAVAADGWAGAQYNLVCSGLATLPEALPDGLAEEVGRRAAELGLRLPALSGTYNMAHPDPAVRGEGRRRFAQVVEAARRMGTPLVTLCTGSRDPENMWRDHPENGSAAAWADLRRELEPALLLAEGAGLRLGIEPEPGNVVRDAVSARRLLDELRSPRLGIVLDAANLLPPEAFPRQREVIDRAVDLLGEAVVLAHAKDVDAAGEVVAAGEGAVDLEHFVAALRASGYDGALVGHGFPAAAAPRVARLLRRLAQAAP